MNETCQKCGEKEKIVNGLYLHIAHCKNGHAWLADPNRIIPAIKERLSQAM